MIFDLLREKGYVGPNELIRVNEWLKTLDVQLIITEIKNETNVSYYAEISFPPHTNRYTGEVYNSIDDAVEVLLYKYLDYIPYKNN